MDNVKNDIATFISSHGIMTLSTSDKDKPWVSTVYYGFSDDFSFYIVTDPNSTHGLHIKNNPNVAFAIYDSSTKVTDSKKGIQGQGICTQVTDIIVATKGLLLWHKYNPGVEAKITVDMIKKLADTRIFKIEPKYIKFFAKELYGEKEYGVLEL